MLIAQALSLACEAAKRPRKVVVLGSTGSLGRLALDIIGQNPHAFELLALAAGSGVECLAGQVFKFSPRYVALAEPPAAESLRRLLKSQAGWGNRSEVLEGAQAVLELAAHPEADIVLVAISGVAGLRPVAKAIEAGKHLALANKESLAVAGEFLERLQQKSQAVIVPVDSEHSAVFQALQGRGLRELREIILTASGGPFLDTPQEKFKHVTPSQAVQHPRWSMGSKISVDSATLMNKALEVIEAHWLFGLAAERIKVLVHPQSIVHALVCLCDGSYLAELSCPDMRGPIAFALAYPAARLDNVMAPLELTAGSLEFRPLNEDKFPAVEMARQCLKVGGVLPAVFTYADELAVEAFLKGRIGFDRIVPLVRQVTEQWKNQNYDSLEQIEELKDQVQRKLQELW